MFSSKASFSACSFFHKIELLLDLDEVVDSLDVKSGSVRSLRPLSLISMYDLDKSFVSHSQLMLLLMNTLAARRLNNFLA